KIASATAATKSPFIRARQKPAPTRPDRTSDCCLRALQVCWPSLGEADARDVGDEIAGRAGDHLFTIVNSPDRRRSATPLAFLASRDLSRAQPALSILGVRGEGRRSLAAEAPKDRLPSPRTPRIDRAGWARLRSREARKARGVADRLRSGLFTIVNK